MADFCYQCTARTFGGEFAHLNDFACDESEPEFVAELCEGCGWAVMDREGRCKHIGCGEAALNASARQEAAVALAEHMNGCNRCNGSAQDSVLGACYDAWELLAAFDRASEPPAPAEEAEETQHDYECICDDCMEKRLP